MIKTIVMLSSLALVTAAGAACFGCSARMRNRRPSSPVKDCRGRRKSTARRSRNPEPLSPVRARCRRPTVCSSPPGASPRCSGCAITAIVSASPITSSGPRCGRCSRRRGRRESVVLRARLGALRARRAALLGRIPCRLRLLRRTARCGARRLGFARAARAELPRGADYFAVAVPLGHAIGRVGCFSAGAVMADRRIRSSSTKPPAWR